MRWPLALNASAPAREEGEGERVPADDAMDARSTMDALGDAIAVVTADWRVHYVNAPWERILGVSRESVIGGDLWEMYPALCVEPGATMMRATAADGSTRRFDLDTFTAGDQRSYGIRVARDAAGCVVVALSRSFQTMR